MFRGSPDLSAGQLANISAAMGGNFDADTQQTVTQYFFTVPAEDLDVALHIEDLRMRGVLDTDELWDQERGAIEQEVAQDLSNPQYVFYTKLLTAMFHGTPYEHDALGSRPSFDKTTGTMLHEFYDKWYAPNNAIMVIVGDVDPQKTLGEVQKLFGDIPEKKIPAAAGGAACERVDADAETGYRPAVWAGGCVVPVAGIGQPGLRGGGYFGGRAEQPAGQFVRSGAGREGAGSGFFAERMPKASVAYAMAAYPQGGNGQALIKEIQKILADDAEEWRARRSGGCGETARGGQRRVSEKFDLGAGDGMVERAGGGRPAIAGGRYSGHRKSDAWRM